MVCLAFEPGTAEWKAQTNPLSYDGPHRLGFVPISPIAKQILLSPPWTVNVTLAFCKHNSLPIWPKMSFNSFYQGALLLTNKVR